MMRWGQRFLESTRGRVVQLLRQGKASVNDLAEKLNLTGNAIRSHLNTLERDGLVRPAGKRSGTRKPETLYTLTPEADRLFPQAYHLLFTSLLDRIAERLPHHEIEAILREIGRGLAAEHAAAANGTFSERTDKALEVLEGMGGLANVEEGDAEYVIRGYSCPLAAVVGHHPAICGLAESLLEEILGTAVTETCDRGGAPTCVFRIPKSDIDG